MSSYGDFEKHFELFSNSLNDILRKVCSINDKLCIILQLRLKCQDLYKKSLGQYNISKDVRFIQLIDNLKELFKVASEEVQKLHAKSLNNIQEIDELYGPFR